jgi:hypothetical protein
MQSNSFYGIYRGVCVDNNDPNKTYRIKLKVPQVLHTNITNWAYPCLPVTDNSNHPDHQAHTAAQVAALLTTTATTASDPQGGSITIPALTVVAKSGAGTLTHPHVTAVNPANLWNGSSGTVFNDSTSTLEHTAHRGVPNINQGVWVMFEGGDPNFPVWMGVY